jgi:Flp pilus assembly protein TadG
MRGQAVVLMAALIVALTFLGAMVFDAGLAMTDRRNLQAYADAAALAGARSYGPGANAAHWVAMQYLGSTLSFAPPTGICSGISSCPAGTYTVGSYTITLSDTWRVNGIFNYPSVLDVVISHQQPSVFARMVGFTTLTAGASARATTPGPQLNGAAYAVAAVSGDAHINGGGAAFQTVTGPVYAYGSFGANNVPHTTGIPSVQTGYNGAACPGNPVNHVDNGGSSNGYYYASTDAGTIGNSINVAPPTNYDTVNFVVPSGTYTSAAAAQDGLGNWKPGTYNGFAPSGGKMNGGVYKIINTAGINLGSITNTNHALSGTSNGADAVAILLDSSDTGALNISSAVLNGLDDLNPPGYTGLRDPAGTHNFVIYSGSGPSGFAGSMTVGPGATTDMSGIIYLPKVSYVSNGNSSPSFTGSLTVATMTVNGGGNGMQVFKWVCGLNAVNGQPYDGGLVR